MYLVRVKITENGHKKIIRVPFEWRRIKGIKSFEPTKIARGMLDQFDEWTNLDVNKSPEELKV